jgi:hypothetical protein
VKRSLRRQIKQNELQSGYETVFDWIGSHKEEMRATLIGALVLAAGVGALYYFRGHRVAEARLAMTDAMAIYTAPVAQQSEEPAAPSRFKSDEERYKEAQLAFEGIARRFPSLAEARRARLLAAACKLNLGDDAGAEADLKGLAGERRKGALEPELAALALADLNRRHGSLDAAVAGLKALSEDPAATIPKDQILLRLARAYEQAQRRAEALAAYQRIVDEFSQSAGASEARRQLDYLRLSVRG